MARFYKFSVLQFLANPLRDERLNVGLAIFHEDTIDVRSARRLDKIKAISGALDPGMITEALDAIVAIDTAIRETGISSVDDRRAELNAFSPLSMSALGSFVAPDADLYEQQIASLLMKLVEAEPAPVDVHKKRSSGLLKSIKGALRAERVLAKAGEGLEAHRVVSNHKIAEGLNADLILKNGAMHVVETVDASSEEGSLRRAVGGVAVSALIFEQARMSFGEGQTRAQLVYTASSVMERAIAPSLQAAEHQGATLVNWESDDDRRALITHLARLATPLERRGLRQPPSVDASVQHRFSIN
jgi:hypothetical protein